jgi:hypothetical protein
MACGMVCFCVDTVVANRGYTGITNSTPACLSLPSVTESVGTKGTILQYLGPGGVSSTGILETATFLLSSYLTSSGESKVPRDAAVGYMLQNFSSSTWQQQQQWLSSLVL